MKILIDICHPAHVHFYKNFIWEMEKRGHIIKVTSRKKDVTSDLLNYYKINHKVISFNLGNLLHLSIETFHRWQRLLKIIKKFKPDIITDVGGAFIAFPSKVCNAKSIVFTDSEFVPINKFITYPFVEKILTPKCFIKDLGKHHIKYNGYHELAYLHPEYFTPNSDILDLLEIRKKQPYFILRFVSWQASHDVLQSGFSIDWKLKIIHELEKYGQVFISSENPVPNKMKHYLIKIPPYKMLDALYYADLFIGDGATMATESALLGTPAIYSSSLVGTMGNFKELMDKYGLVYSYRSPDKALKKALEILDKSDYKAIWMIKKKKLFEDKINVTKFMIEFFENYLDSVNML